MRTAAPLGGLAGIALALIVTAPGHRRPPPRPPARPRPPVPTVIAAAPAATAPPPPATPPAASNAAGQARAAPARLIGARAAPVLLITREFLVGWALLQVGASPRRARALLADTASPALARWLVARPPAPVPGLYPALEAPTRLTAYETRGGWSVIAELRGGPERDAVLLTLLPGPGGKLRVGRLEP
ncbi:MAG TPA: hypothetical protein VHX88_00400 [Solirubrobacteraceae bacterium]|nr:hypothetical protein [Solirubrobacteraceae bacterium]